MANPKRGVFGDLEASSDHATFPSADVNGELNPGVPNNFPVDPKFSEIETSRMLKERTEEEESRKREKKLQEDEEKQKKLKSTFMVSGVVLAVIGAVFALTKKLREKPTAGNTGSY